MPTNTPAAPKKTTRKAASTVSASKPEAAAAEAPVKKRTRKVAKPNGISREERHHLIEVAAYYLAERRGFGEGSYHDDWLQAESQIDQMIAEGKFAS